MWRVKGPVLDSPLEEKHFLCGLQHLSPPPCPVAPSLPTPQQKDLPKPHWGPPTPPTSAAAALGPKIWLDSRGDPGDPPALSLSPPWEPFPFGAASLPTVPLSPPGFPQLHPQNLDSPYLLHIPVLPQPLVAPLLHSASRRGGCGPVSLHQRESSPGLGPTPRGHGCVAGTQPRAPAKPDGWVSECTSQCPNACPAPAPICNFPGSNPTFSCPQDSAPGPAPHRAPRGTAGMASSLQLP